jgi:hypothetical protein
MKGTNWTPEEDNRLLDLVNQYKSKTGRGIRWERIPMGKFWRTPDALKNRWNHDLKHRTDMVDGAWVLNQMQLEMEPSKVKVVHETPLKVKKLKKSFLWGLYTVEREE